jgi:hypothetical protein
MSSCQVGTNHVRNQKKHQNARQATMISGLSTIYRNQTTTHLIQTRQQTEPRIFLLDITLDDMNAMYSKIHGIIEKGRIRPKGTEEYFVYKKKEHLIISEDAIYEIRRENGTKMRNMSTTTLIERIPIDGAVTTTEIHVSRDYPNENAANHANAVEQTLHVIPLLVDESYYKLTPTNSTNSPSDSFIGSGSHVSSNHILIRHMKVVVKLHPKSMNSFVFIMNENETRVLDFYITTENGIIESKQPDGDIITKTCKDDIISFIDHFKLCS